MFAGQVHGESSWNCDAKSPYAEGCAQFTTDTAEWASSKWADLDPPMVRSPGWAFKAMVRYMVWICDRVPPMVDECERWATCLSGYNGGPGWMRRDWELSGQDDKWFLGVELYSNRSWQAFSENRRYPRRIMYDLQPIYLGWGGLPVCLD